MPNIPGLSLSILRQDTTTEAGRPVLISGRFTVFGLGFPALVRVALEGPSYNPEIRTFDAFAQPFTGEYNTQVVAEKDGEYTLSAQAYPLPGLPSGPLIPANLLLLPPVAESPKPPLVVGAPAAGGVNARLPAGQQFLAQPPQTPIEVQVSVGAPSVFVTVPGGGGAGVFGLPFLPAPPAPAPAPTPAPAAVKAAVIDDIRMFPDTISPGQAGTGFMGWRNIGRETAYFNISFYLAGPSGTRYGPLQIQAYVRAFPEAVITTPIQLNTVGLSENTYDITADITDSQTGALVNSRTFSLRLKISAMPGVAAPAPPPPAPAPAPAPGPLPPPPTLPPPEAPTSQTFPTLPTADMLGAPTSDLPSQGTIGE